MEETAQSISDFI
jgi:hypothetical protein